MNVTPILTESIDDEPGGETGYGYTLTNDTFMLFKMVMGSWVETNVSYMSDVGIIALVEVMTVFDIIHAVRYNRSLMYFLGLAAESGDNPTYMMVDGDTVVSQYAGSQYIIDIRA